MISAHKNFAQFALSEATGFGSLNDDIDTDLMDLHQRIEAIELKIHANVRNIENSDGFITRSVQDYLSCLERRHQNLEFLFRGDNAFLTKNAQTAGEAIYQHMQDILQRT